MFSKALFSHFFISSTRVPSRTGTTYSVGDTESLEYSTAIKVAPQADPKKVSIAIKPFESQRQSDNQPVAGRRNHGT